MQMSKNRPRVNARDGKFWSLEFLPANKLKTVISASSYPLWLELTSAAIPAGRARWA